MKFHQFAYNNVRRNARAYGAYYLSSTFMVMIFFSFAAFARHPEIAATTMGQLTSLLMNIAGYIIFLFAIFFVTYSTGAFLKSRNREFGILLILGARPGQISKLIFLENLLIGVCAMLSGLACGLLLFKLFLLLGSKIMDMQELPFYWPVSAIWLTIGTFSLLFVGLSWFTLIFVRKSKVLELLQGSQKPKNIHQASVVLVILGAALLATAVIALYKYSPTRSSVLIAAISGIAGTYLFYSQLSVYIIRLLKRNRLYTWRKTNLLWVSEMAYKMRDNAQILFLVTVVTSVACMSTSMVLAINQMNREGYIQDPYAIRVYDFHAQQAQNDIALIDRQLDEAGVGSQKVSLYDITGWISDNRFNQVYSMTASDFGKVADQMGISFTPGHTPKENEAFLVRNSNQPAAEEVRELKLQDGSTIAIVRTSRTEKLAKQEFAGSLLVVNDQEIVRMQKLKPNSRWVLYLVPQWVNQSPSADSEEAVVGQRLKQLQDEKKIGAFLKIRMMNYLITKQTTLTLNFIGVFIAFLFSLSSASFLYFKLYTELVADSRMYRSLSKIGLSTAEMKKSVTLQIALLFFMPMLVSSIQTLVVLMPIFESADQMHMMSSVLTMSVVFVTAQAVYFYMVRTRYLQRLKKVMV